MQVKVSEANVWVTIFIKTMQVGASVAILQVVISRVHYAHDYFDWVMHVTVSVVDKYVAVSISNFYFFL